MRVCREKRFDCLHREMREGKGGGILRVRLCRIAIRKVLLSFKFCNVFVNANVSLLETTFYE
jgi:hypothetical protein